MLHRTLFDGVEVSLKLFKVQGLLLKVLFVHQQSRHDQWHQGDQQLTHNRKNLAGGLDGQTSKSLLDEFAGDDRHLPIPK